MNAIVRCEICDKSLGPELLDCPERGKEGGSCPYEVHETRASGCSVLITMTLIYLPVFLLLASGAVLLTMSTITDLREGLGLSFSTLLAPVFVAATVGWSFVSVRQLQKKLKTKQVWLQNPETGAFYLQRVKNGKVLEQNLGTPYTKLQLSRDGLIHIPYPASLATLTLEQEKISGWRDRADRAARLVTAALINLTAEGKISLNTAQLFIGQADDDLAPATPAHFYRAWNQYPSQILHKQSLVFITPIAPSSTEVDGVIEQALWDALHQATAKTKFGVAPSELIDQVRKDNRVRSNYGRWIIRQANKDAASRNLGQQQTLGGLKIDPQIASQLEPQAQIVRDVVEGHEALQNFQKQIQKTIRDVDKPD